MISITSFISHIILLLLIFSLFDSYLKLFSSIKSILIYLTDQYCEIIFCQGFYSIKLTAEIFERPVDQYFNISIQFDSFK